MTLAREQITGVVLAGGRGSRMGGVDKGLQIVQGMPLAMHAVLRLSPQVGELMINANRNLGAYEAMGVPVWPDPLPDFAGPLAGFLAGLERCETPLHGHRAVRHAALSRGSGGAPGACAAGGRCRDRDGGCARGRPRSGRSRCSA